MANHRIDGEDQEALYSSFPCADYYVQSPSTISHANSADCRNNESAFVSPYRSQNYITNPTVSQDVSRFALSRYSSSRGSNNSFLHKKALTESGEIRLISCEIDHIKEEEDDDDDGHEDGRRRGCWRFFSFRTSSSCLWISLQISWRLFLSLGVALIVFYLATKPPPPKMSIKMVGITQFELGEGVDGSGVATNLLTCNCSMDLVIDNKSKLFGLHIHPPIIEMSFGILPLAISQGPKLYAESYGRTTFKLYVGTRKKAMYGAGRSMEDMLEAGGLPLRIQMSLSSSFRVVWNLIRPRFHHNAECLLLLGGGHHKRHGTRVYNSSCTISS